jgi:hypothetical protein
MMFPAGLMFVLMNSLMEYIFIGFQSEMKYTAENLSRNNQIAVINCLRQDHPLNMLLSSCYPDLLAKFILHHTII